MKIPYFFVIEGIDGSGKSTVIEIIKTFISRMHFSDCFVFLYEPTNLTYGRLIRQYLKEHKELSLEKWIELFENDRKENLKKNIEPNQHKVILMDRYYFSTAAYQAKHLEEVKKILDYFYYNFPKPTQVFYLDITVDEAIKRISNRLKETGKTFELFEKEDELKRILFHYQYLQKLSKEYKISWKNIHALDSPHKIAKKILRNVFSTIRNTKNRNS